MTGNDEKPETVLEGREKKPTVDQEDKAADSIFYRMFHWKFTVEQKEKVKWGNGCLCAKRSDTIIFLSRNFCCADDGDTQEV